MAARRRKARKSSKSRSRKNPWMTASGRVLYPERCTVPVATRLLNKRKSQILSGSKKRVASKGSCRVADAEFTVMLSGLSRKPRKGLTAAQKRAVTKRRATLKKARKLIGKDYSPKFQSSGRTPSRIEARRRRSAAQVAAGRKTERLSARASRRARANPVSVFPNPARKSGGKGLLKLLNDTFGF